MEHLLPYAAAVLKLLKGPVNYDVDPKEWDLIVTYQNDSKKYFEKIGLSLYTNIFLYRLTLPCLQSFYEKD